MFGFSFTKLLLLVVVIAGIWYLFKAISRRNAAREQAALGRPATPDAQPKAAAADAVQDLRRCPTCGAYAATPCERGDCPIRG